MHDSDFKPPRKTLSRLLRFFLLALILGVVFLAVLIAHFESQLPDVSELKNIQLQTPLRIYAQEGSLIAEYGTKRRIPIPFNQIPKQMVEATIATEDARFYEHPGVDFIGLIRAAGVLIATGHKEQGGSTITMQVARNYFLTRKKTFSRKIREILLAIKINHDLPKNKILELYFNKIFYGQRAYGIASAAQIYYGKTPQELTLAEMAMLAGLPKAPSTLNPLSHPQAAIDRRTHVLDRMLKLHYISQAEYDEAVNAPISAHFHDLVIQVSAPYVAETIRQQMLAQYGEEAYTLGLNVYTTIDPALQKAANQAVRSGLLAYSARHGFRGPLKNLGTPPEDLSSWKAELSNIPAVSGLQPAAITAVSDQSATAILSSGASINLPFSSMTWARTEFVKNGSEYFNARPNSATQVLKLGDVVYVIHESNGWALSQLPAAQAALISLDPVTGNVRALVGGFGDPAGHFNRVIQARLQPGSGFKPFIYSAALAKNYTLATLLNDAPIVINGSNNSDTWRPENDTMKFYGLTSLETSLIKSRNLASIRLLQMIGLPYAIQYATRFGFSEDQLPEGLSLALGTALVSPWQLAQAYAVFANGGFLITPHLIDHINNAAGQVLYQDTSLKACTDCLSSEGPPPAGFASQVISPQNAYLMTTAMKGVILQGTGRPVLVLHRSDLAGKTGTSNDYQNVWFNGYNHDLVTVVWVGFDQPRSLFEYARTASLPIWIDFMGQALKGQPPADLPEPPGLVSVRINPSTGLLAGPEDPNALFQVFTENTVPKASAKANADQSGTHMEQMIYQ